MEADLADMREDHAEERERIEAERDVAVEALELLRVLESDSTTPKSDTPVPKETRGTTDDLDTDYSRTRDRGRLSRLVVAALIMCGVWTSTLVLTAISPLLWLIAFFSLPLWYLLFLLFNRFNDSHESCESSLILACFVATLPMVNNAPLVLHGLLGDAVTEVTLDQGSEHSDALFVRLDEGRVSIDQQFRGSWAIEDGQMNAFIAPIVSPGWHRGDPITAWAVCMSSRGPETLEECTSKWEEPHVGGVLLAQSDGIDWAIQDAVETEGLVAQDDAMYIRWDDPAPILRSVIQKAIWGLLGCYLVWAIWFLMRSDP